MGKTLDSQALNASLACARNWAEAVIRGDKPDPRGVSVRCLRQGWDFLRYDCSIVDAPLTLAGKVFKRGLGTHADSEIRIRTNQPIRAFRAWVGMDDNPDCRNANPGSPERLLFAVEANGRELWRSAPLGVASQPARVEVAVDGATELLLKAWDVNGKINHAHADWADAEIELAAVGCTGTRPTLETPAMTKPALTAAEFAREFCAPPPSCRILKINHGWSGDEAGRAGYVATLQRQGFGGAVTNVGFGDGYVTNPKQWAAFRAGVEAMRATGLEMWLYDEAGYPSGRAGGLVLEGHPEREARALLATVARTEVGPDGSRNIGPKARASASSTDARGGTEVPTCTLAVPPGVLRLARAFRETEDGGLALAGAIDLPPPANGSITWAVPPGRWQLWAVSEDRLFDGSQVDFSGVPEHAPYVNLLDPDTMAAFLELTHEAYARELGPRLGGWFVATFTDEPSLLASYYARPMPWRPIAWHPRLATEFAARTGRALEPELPLLFADGPGAERTRHDFWQTVAVAFRENYFSRIRTWCREHGIPSGGHLLLEEDIRFHVSLYGDFLACLRELDVPGIDVLSSDPAHSPWYTARLASSAAELEGGSLVMSESSDFIEMWAKPPRPVSLAQFRGTMNRQMLGGVNRFNTYSPFRDLADADLVQLNEWTGRCCLALGGGIRNARIGVLYPIETAWTRFRPSRQGFAEAGALSERLAKVIRQVDDLLYGARREFSYLDSRSLAEAAAVGGELRLRDLAWSVVVLPDADTLPAAAWEGLERFWEAGGAIIAAGALPRNSEREFPSVAAAQCGLRIFGRRADDSPATPSQATSREGGRGVYLPPEHVAELPAILDALLGPDVRMSDPAAPIRIARRAISGRDVYLLINDSPEPWRGTVTFGQPHPAGELLDPATGSIQPLPDPGRVDLSLAGWGAAIVRLEGVSHVPRR